ncbi:MAG: gliding motility-associated C-terminal domain-containing protein [Elusimicrobiota bacterium]|nr:gliding motility-associated C-terminal domain-containing protein [Elusimicrobiota bacterium]
MGDALGRMSAWLRLSSAGAGLLAILLASPTPARADANPANDAGQFSVRMTPTDIWPPEPVTDLAGTAGAEGQALLEWTAPDENHGVGRTPTPVVSYVIHASTLSAADLGNDTTAWFSLSTPVAGAPSPLAPGNPQALLLSLNPGVTYYFGLKSVDDAANLSESDAQLKSLAGQVVVPVKGIDGVSNLAAATGAGFGSIDLAWTHPRRIGQIDPSYYDIRVSSTGQISNNAEFNAASPLSALSPSPLAAVGAPGDPAAMTVTGLASGIGYAFAVRLRDAGSFAGVWVRNVAANLNANNFAVASGVAPVAITDLTGLAGPGEGQVSLAWTAPYPPPLLSYRVFHATFSVASVGGSTAAWRAAALSSSTVVASSAAPGDLETTVLTLNPGVRYHFGVEASNPLGAGALDALSAGAQVEVRARGLAPVTDLVAAPGPLATGVTLSWTEPFVSSVTAPASYQIKVSTLGFLNGATDYAAARDLQSFATVAIPAYGAGGAAASVQAAGLMPFVTHYFAIRLVDGSTPTLTGAWLRVPAEGRNLNTSAVPLFVPNPPEPVSNLTALPGAGEGDVTLAWTAPLNTNLVAVASYEVRFATISASAAGSTTAWHAAASSAAFAGALAPGALETRTIGGLFPAATWYFSVKSVDATGVVSPIDTKSTGAFQAATMPRSLAPSTPAGLTGVAGNRSATLAWADLSAAGKGLDFDHYRLERSTDLLSFVSVTTTTGTGFIDAPLPAKVTDYYRLIARDLRGNESVASSTVSVVPFTILPMEPLGVTVSATALDVTLAWSPVTRFGDGSPFFSTGTWDVDELIGYSVFRSTGAFDLEFVHVSSLPYITTTLVNGTGGLGYFYHIKSYNTQGLSTNTLTVSSLGQRLFSVDSAGTTLTLDAASSLMLNAATNGLGGDVRIMSTRRPEDVGGSVFQSAKWTAFLNGETELKGFALPKPARVTLHFDTLDGVVVPTTAPVSGLSVAGLGAGAAPAAVSPKNVGVYWHNGSEFKKLYGNVDANAQTVTVESPNLGLYQIRSLFRAEGAVFDLSNISGRVVTPNGDGLNDLIIFSYDPGPRGVQARGRIYDMTGAFVADMAPGLVPNTVVWNGKMNGRPASSGVYVYKIEGDGKTYTGTVVVAR